MCSDLIVELSFFGVGLLHVSIDRLNLLPESEFEFPIFDIVELREAGIHVGGECILSVDCAVRFETATLFSNFEGSGFFILSFTSLSVGDDHLRANR